MTRILEFLELDLWLFGSPRADITLFQNDPASSGSSPPDAEAIKKSSLFLKSRWRSTAGFQMETIQEIRMILVDQLLLLFEP